MDRGGYTFRGWIMTQVYRVYCTCASCMILLLHSLHTLWLLHCTVNFCNENRCLILKPVVQAQRAQPVTTHPNSWRNSTTTKNEQHIHSRTSDKWKGMILLYKINIINIIIYKQKIVLAPRPSFLQEHPLVQTLFWMSELWGASPARAKRRKKVKILNFLLTI